MSGSASITALDGELEAYFRATARALPEAEKAERVAWRVSCFDIGSTYAEYIERNEFSLLGKRVLDLACAWGGHAIAFATRGARVTGADLNDHRFPSLRRFASTRRIALSLARANCEELPFASAKFDVVLALELIEHIRSPERLAAEVARVLRPGGVCLLSTPARLLSMIFGEPHYKVKGLPLLPFFLQSWVATKLLRRSYPFPITRQYATASAAIAPFASAGLQGQAIVRARRLSGTLLEPIAQQLFWSFIVLRKPPATPGLRRITSPY